MIGSTIFAIICVILIFRLNDEKNKRLQAEAREQRNKQQYEKKIAALWQMRFKSCLKYYKQLKADGYPDRLIEEKIPDTTNF